MKGTRLWGLLHVALVAAFLTTVATYYHPGVGLTAFLTIPASEPGSPYELAAIQHVPHAVDPVGGGYDGQFYARLALEPLLTDPAIDQTLDLAPYRARRILLSWTAYALGFGRALWILHIFAVQNVVVWLIFAWLLTRWFRVGTPRSFALWAGCLFAHGMLSSVRYALIDAPSALLVTAAVAAYEDGRPWWSAAAIGAAGLTRETSLVAISMFWSRLTRQPRSWIRVAGYAIVAVLPLAIWMDYLRSIYRGAVWESGGNLTWPLQGLVWKAGVTIHTMLHGGMNAQTLSSACALVAFVSQCGYVLWRLRSHEARASAWMPIALSYAVLGICAHRVVWDGSPGAVTRVALPLTIAFNVLARKAPWTIIVLGNLGVVSGVLAFVFRM